MLLLDQSAAPAERCRDYLFCEWATADGEPCLPVLQRAIAKNRWSGLPCYALLSDTDYQLLLVDAPKVPPHEQRDAVRWAIKDLVTIDSEQAVIDIFPQPLKDKLYVVVAEADTIKTIVKTSDALGLCLQTIDIAELSMRNFIDQLPVSDRACAFVIIQQAMGKLCIFKGGNLYLSRVFSLNDRGAIAGQSSQARMILEIQRSLDYYERQLGELQPDRIFMVGDAVDDSGTTASLRLGFTQTLVPLTRAEWFSGLCQTASMSDLISLYGAALRHKAV